MDERDEATAAELEMVEAIGRTLMRDPDHPAWSDARCNTSVFTARDERTFHEAFARAGLGCTAIHGIDPLPLKTRFLPLYGRLPRPLALLGLAAITAVSLPYDLLFGGRQPQRSWHKLFVLTRT